MNEVVKPLADQEVDWIGTVKYEDLGSYIDYGLLLIFGGIPWQVSSNTNDVIFATIAFLFYPLLGVLPKSVVQ